MEGKGGEVVALPDVPTADSIVFEGATIETPGGGGSAGSGGAGTGGEGGAPLALARQLSLRVDAGASVLISGPNGSGKTSVVRTLAGLWPLREGRIHLPTPHPPSPCSSNPALFFVTQKPYMPIGSLRAGLVYPTQEAHAINAGMSI